MLISYEEMRISLAHDDLTKLERIAARWLENSAIAYRCLHPSNSLQIVIHSNRNAKLSEEAIRLAERHKE